MLYNLNVQLRALEMYINLLAQGFYFLMFAFHAQTKTIESYHATLVHRLWHVKVGTIYLP